MRMVYLLWSTDKDGLRLEEIFADKVLAEAVMRRFKSMDAQSGLNIQYWIQEKEVK